MILGVWSASLTLPGYGRLARHAPAIACDGELRPEGGTCQVIGPLPRIWVEMRICLTLELIPSFRLIL